MAEIPATRASLLVRLRNSRDDAAWKEFIDLYGPLIYNYVRKQGLQDADAADLGQEVLRSMVGSVERLEYDPLRGSFRNWLFTIVRRKLSNWRAARATQLRGSGDSSTQDMLEELPAPESEDAEWRAEWENRLFAWACTQVCKDVSDSTWQAFWRTAVDGQPTRRVAAELGLTATAVYLARRRVLVRIKELVQSVQEP